MLGFGFYRPLSFFLRLKRSGALDHLQVFVGLVRFKDAVARRILKQKIGLCLLTKTTFLHPLLYGNGFLRLGVGIF